MAFDINDFKMVNAGGGTQKIFAYTTNDLPSVIEATAYFPVSGANSVYEYISVGDLILATTDADGTPNVRVYVVTATSSSAVTVAKAVGDLVVLNAQIVDISTADQVYVVSPVAGDIVAIYSVIEAAIGTADADLTAKIGGVAVTGGLITVATSGSAAGDVDSCTPTAANTVAAGGAIEVETDGASSNTVLVNLTIVISPSS
jgi:hypothetical protein